MSSLDEVLCRWQKASSPSHFVFVLPYVWATQWSLLFLLWFLEKCWLTWRSPLQKHELNLPLLTGMRSSFSSADASSSVSENAAALHAIWVSDREILFVFDTLFLLPLRRVWTLLSVRSKRWGWHNKGPWAQSALCHLQIMSTCKKLSSPGFKFKSCSGNKTELCLSGIGLRSGGMWGSHSSHKDQQRMLERLLYQAS